MSADPIRVAVIGVGAFGRNHARVYRDLQTSGAEPRVELAAIVDADTERGMAIAREFGVRAYKSVQALLDNEKQLHAASVAVPTVAHLEIAKTLMRGGLDVLIEKPIATSLAEADELIMVAQQSERVAMVGHLERFNPAVRATFPIITRPMFFEVHRLSLFTPRALDVDVVLDLMIHDLDVVLSFVNSPVREIRAVGLPVITPKVDIANVRVEFDSGCVANFTASRVSTERVRKVRFFQPNQYVSVDYSRQDVFVLTVHQPVAGDLPSGFAIPGVMPSKPKVEQEEPLRAELRSFLNSVATRSKPEVPLEDGRRALALALEILREIAIHTQRANLAPITPKPVV